MRRLLTVLFISRAVSADTYTETFTDATRFSTTGTAVVNLVSRTIHLPWIVDRLGEAAPSNNFVDAEDDAVNVGTGADGAFSSSTYASFDVNGGASATSVTLDSSRTYQFTTFTLDSGITLTVSGTSPLTIRVQGNMTIGGSINLNGLGLSTGSGVGGTGVASGVVGNTSGGGGGGTYDGSTGGQIGTAGTGGAGGAPGSGYGDVYLSTVAVGSGGGAGGAYSIGAPANQSAGGSGGRGGGALSLHVGGNFLVEATGSIYANGANGSGLGSGTLYGGSGGGGSGGAILCFAGGTFINHGTIKAVKGLGGTGSGGGAGGDGGAGRTRYVDSTGSLSQNTDPGLVQDPEPNMADFGGTYYSKQTHQVESAVIDTGNTSPTYVSLNVTETKPSGTAIVYTFAGSNDGFLNDTTEWVSRADLATLSGKRYLKYRAALSTTIRANTPVISALSIEYQPHLQEEFRFKAAGCGSVKREKTDWWGGVWTLCWILPVLLLPRFSRFASRR